MHRKAGSVEDKTVLVEWTDEEAVIQAYQELPGDRLKPIGIIRMNQYGFYHCGNGRVYSNPLPAAFDLLLGITNNNQPKPHKEQRPCKTTPLQTRIQSAISAIS